MATMDPTLVKITASQLQARLASGDLEVDQTLARKAGVTIYRDRTGHWLVFILPDTQRAWLYRSRAELMNWMKRMDALLHGSLPTSAAELLGLDGTFLDRIPELVQSLPAVLNAEAFRCDYSVESVERLDQALRDRERGPSMEPDAVLPLWAYVGEVICRQTGAHWQMLPARSGESPQPMVVNDVGRRVGVADLYKELLEYSEEGSLAVVVLTSIHHLRRI
jgi:hypothetical protein